MSQASSSFIGHVALCDLSNACPLITHPFILLILLCLPGLLCFVTVGEEQDYQNERIVELGFDDLVYPSDGEPA